MSNNHCFNCGYCWYDEDLGYETCHYHEDEPHEWSPCEAADEADRIEMERREYEDFKRQIEEEYRDED